MTHHMWPQNEVRRLLQRASSFTHFTAARNTLVDKLHRFNIPTSVIEMACAIFPAQKCQLLRDSYALLRAVRERKELKRTQTIWLVLPFHWRWLEGGLAGVVKTYCESAMHAKLLVPIGINIQARVSWKPGTKPLGVEVQDQRVIGWMEG